MSFRLICILAVLFLRPVLNFALLAIARYALCPGLCEMYECCVIYRYACQRSWLAGIDFNNVCAIRTLEVWVKRLFPCGGHGMCVSRIASSGMYSPFARFQEELEYEKVLWTVWICEMGGHYLNTVPYLSFHVFQSFMLISSSSSMIWRVNATSSSYLTSLIAFSSHHLETPVWRQKLESSRLLFIPTPSSFPYYSGYSLRHSLGQCLVWRKEASELVVCSLVLSKSCPGAVSGRLIMRSMSCGNLKWLLGLPGDIEWYDVFQFLHESS